MSEVSRENNFNNETLHRVARGGFEWHHICAPRDPEELPEDSEAKKIVLAAREIHEVETRMRAEVGEILKKYGLEDWHASITITSAR